MEGGEQKEGHKPRLIIRIAFSFLFFFCFLFSFKAAGASAATLYLSPATGGYKAGQTFSAGVFVSSADQALNAVSGIINFPQDKLEVISLSKSGSLISLWVSEPGFFNSSGAVNFEGIVLNPGFTGSGGRILTINFKVKAAGSASLTFSSAAILANDGLGTNILTGMGSAKYDLISTTPSQPVAEEAQAQTPAEAESASAGRVPYAPAISSGTHPDQASWYGVNVPKFNWTVPAGVSGVRLLVGKIPQAYPSVTYAPPISSRELGELEDGVWYFHLRFRNASGWGDVSHFKFQIDTEKPESFKMSQSPRSDLTEPRVELFLEAVDKTSGLDHYEIQINGFEPQIWRDDGSHAYKSPLLSPGQYTVTAKAVDKAGNFLSQTAEFTVEPLPAPEIIEYPKLLTPGDILTIKGISIPHSKAIIFIESGDSVVYSEEVPADSTGKFILITPNKLPPGDYYVYAQVRDERGAISELSGKIDLIIQSEHLWNIATWPLDFIMTVLILAIALMVLILLTLFKGRKTLRYAKHIHRAELELNGVIDSLRRDIKDRINILTKLKAKKRLTRQELKIIKKVNRKYRRVKAREKNQKKVRRFKPV
jgi:hypothetical protein